MEIIVKICQAIIALGILNVWIFRFSKATDWRGGDAKNLKEEFAVYGLPFWFMMFIGVLKIGAAIGLALGIVYPNFTSPSAYTMSILMAGAIFMHIKVKDPFIKSLPAALMLAMSLLVSIFGVTSV